ncbi:MAG: hypothetical protein ICV60_22540 [Pyrinomonadaceae bacterium]|nr:hypothetical protein [Pyrinomonadaceae bacterium]
MLSIYSCTRKRFLAGTLVIAAGLAVALFAQTAQAQDMAAVRRAIVSATGSRAFLIDTTGRTGSAESILEINRLDDSGALVGKYYAPGTQSPTATNVTGTVTITPATAPGTRNGIGISFTVTQRGGLFVNQTVFDGAILISGTARQPFAFMAGTYTVTTAGGISGGPARFPFCAKVTSIPG